MQEPEDEELAPQVRTACDFGGASTFKLTLVFYLLAMGEVVTAAASRELLQNPALVGSYLGHVAEGPVGVDA